MKKKVFALAAFLLTFSLISLSSCGDDEDEELGEGIKIEDLK